MKRLRIGGLAAVVLITLALASEQAGAIPAVVNISNNAGTSYWPSIGVNGTTALAVWQDSTPGNYDIFMGRSLNTGATWAAPVNLTSTAGTSQEYDWTFAGTQESPNQSIDIRWNHRGGSSTTHGRELLGQ